MLDDKVAVIYGAGGSIGGAVARAFASEGFFNLSGNNRNVVAEWFGSTGALIVGRRILEDDEP